MRGKKRENLKEYLNYQMSRTQVPASKSNQMKYGSLRHNVYESIWQPDTEIAIAVGYLPICHSLQVSTPNGVNFKCISRGQKVVRSQNKVHTRNPRVKTHTRKCQERHKILFDQNATLW